MSKIFASPTDKWLLCTTCGKATHKIQIRRSPSLKNIKHKPKTYRRMVGDSETHKKMVGGKIKKEKEIYWSYFMMECIEKHHKLSVRKAPFSRKLVSKIF